MRRLYSKEKKRGGNKMKGNKKRREGDKKYHGSLSHRRQNLLRKC
jgi:hypothetical protein